MAVGEVNLSRDASNGSGELGDEGEGLCSSKGLCGGEESCGSEGLHGSEGSCGSKGLCSGKRLCDRGVRLWLILTSSLPPSGPQPFSLADVCPPRNSST